jgi:hypothetical protein
LQHGTEDTAQPAEVLWRHSYEDVTIPKTDLLKAKSPYAKVDLVKFKFDEAILNLRARISIASFVTDSSGQGLDHLFQAIDDGVDFTTYAGIAHSNAFWKPGIAGVNRGTAGSGVRDIAGAVAALVDIESQYGAATDGDEQPTLIITTQKGYDFIWGQMQALQRYTRDEEMTKAGFEALKFNRAVVLVDRNMPINTGAAVNGGSALFINENWVDLVSHEDENFAVDPILPGTPSERSVNTKIVWSGNWRVKVPRYQAKIVGATNFQ